MGCCCLGGGRRGAFHARYGLEERLGKGSYGQVWACRDLQSQERLAVKILCLWPQGAGGARKLRTGSKTRQERQELRRQAHREAEIWVRIGQHEHCVRLHKVYMDGTLCYLVMEPCERSVVKALEEMWPWPVEADVLRIVYELMLALRHIHQRGIAHRDVKPDNALLGGELGSVTKLCDFGLAAALPPPGQHLQEVVGTPPYMAPEMLISHRHNEKVDSWSLGATAYVMLYGRFPYEPKGKDVSTVKLVIRAGVPVPKYKPVGKHPGPSLLAERVVRLLLQRDPVKRATLHKLLDSHLGRELAKAAASGGEGAHSVSSPASFLPVVLAAQKEITYFRAPSSSWQIEELVRQTEALRPRRFSAPASSSGMGSCSGSDSESNAGDEEGGEPSSPDKRWRRWSTGAPQAAQLTRSRTAAPLARRTDSWSGPLPQAPALDDGWPSVRTPSLPPGALSPTPGADAGAGGVWLDLEAPSRPTLLGRRFSGLPGAVGDGDMKAAWVTEE